MPLLVKPFLIQLPQKGEYVISFSYTFAGDNVQELVFSGFTSPGAQFILNSTSFQGVQNLPQFRTLNINAVFNIADPNIDGPVLIYIPATGQIVSLTPSNIQSGISQATQVLMTACIPIMTTQNLEIRFINFQSRATSPETDVEIQVSLSTERMDAFVTQGIWL